MQTQEHYAYTLASERTCVASKWGAMVAFGMAAVSGRMLSNCSRVTLSSSRTSSFFVVAEYAHPTTGSPSATISMSAR
eukprot:m.292186 g.292186  ORF g.292186 m.292186 type:complete len:78 (+) comp19995_c1_seq2:619-852(+)